MMENATELLGPPQLPDVYRAFAAYVDAAATLLGGLGVQPEMRMPFPMTSGFGRTVTSFGCRKPLRPVGYSSVSPPLSACTG